MDVKTAYLNNTLKEKVYMRQPPGYSTPRQEHLVCELRKSLYGLKQSVHNCNRKISRWLRRHSLLYASADNNLYYHYTSKQIVILILYVDDLLITGNYTSKITWLQQKLQDRFKMSYLGALTKYLGIEFNQTASGITIHQTAYANEILEQYGLDQCNPTKTPLTTGFTTSKNIGTPPVDPIEYRSLIGKLVFLVTTHLDLAYPINLLSRYNLAPQLQHLKAAKQIMCYIKGTLGHGLTYSWAPALQFQGYSDADWGGGILTSVNPPGLSFSLSMTLLSPGAPKSKPA
jgi:hypothetical protein